LSECPDSIFVLLFISIIFFLVSYCILIDSFDFFTFFSETVSLISRFAMMEAKFGEMERALALFDSILVSYPQRVDVWSVCVDQLCKAGMIDQAR